MSIPASRAKPLGLLLLFVGAQGALRYFNEEKVMRTDREFVRSYDPRGIRVETLRKRTERAYFQIRGSFTRGPVWPGLASMEFSVTWLRILASIYDEASVEGDFSWLFHKLRFVAQVLPASESAFRSALVPLFVILGKDPSGALYLLNEKLTRGKEALDWRVPYWAGINALENLHEKPMAGDLFLKAAKFPGSPDYLAALGFRLLEGNEVLDQSHLRQEALNRLDPELLEKLKKIRPEWFL